MSDKFEYSGNELETFVFAKSWRNYWIGMIREFLGSEVLEVGAGLGTITKAMYSPDMSWVALEPDRAMCDTLKSDLGRCYPEIEVCHSTLSQYGEKRSFDSILYTDVLEHIENDREEVTLAASRLKPEGYLVILVPAHQSLYSPFDQAIGHFRRYNRKSLDALRPYFMVQVMSRYLDSGGFFLSWANSKFLEQSAPTAAQVKIWYSFVVPISRTVDRMFGFRFGKSLLVIWQLSSNRVT